MEDNTTTNIEMMQSASERAMNPSRYEMGKDSAEKVQFVADYIASGLRRDWDAMDHGTRGESGITFDWLKWLRGL